MALSTRPALATRTNLDLPQRKLTSFLSTRPDQKPKRRREVEERRHDCKRAKVAEPSESESEETEGEFEDADDEDTYMEVPQIAHARARRSTQFNVLNSRMVDASIHPRIHARMFLPMH